MSSTGLYSGLYQTMYETATLVDDVLVTLKTREHCDTDACVKLAHVLINLASKESRSLPTRLLALALDDVHSISSTDGRTIGEALLSNQPSRQTIDALERLARALELMQVQSLARMREGGYE